MNIFAILLLAQAVGRPLPQGVAPAREVAPVLALPEPGLDDTAAYRGYRTRFFQDSKGNAVQIYLKPSEGRVVQLWADAADESVGFTARDASGRPARLSWGSDSAVVSDSANVRSIEYTLAAGSPRLTVGFFLLGSMRVERDFQYERGHLRPFGAPPFQQRELVQLITNLARLAPAEQQRHLALLHAQSTQQLRARLQPTVRSVRTDSSWVIRVEQPSFDARNHLTLELRVDPRQTTAHLAERAVSFRSTSARPVRLTVRVATDAAPLTPLTRKEIFNDDFMHFFAQARATHDSAENLAPRSDAGVPDSASILRYRWLEREIRGVELLSSKEKLMAGLPNFATYFGRDMMMTALLMQSVWSPVMSEHVIASVLRKLGPSGDVSHEEALGGQAIRENAAVYDSLLAVYSRSTGKGDPARADSALSQARTVLGNLQATRENYHMRDDEFQLPLLEARYLSDSAVPAERKRAFLMEQERGVSRLSLMLRELALVARLVEPYAQESVATNLVSFAKRDSTHWQSGSWRDSGAGYAKGRFAMDINVIWVPQALAAIQQILVALQTLGFTHEELQRAAQGVEGPLWEFARDSASLRHALEAWRGTARHFLVAIGPKDAKARIAAKLNWLPPQERSYWSRVLAANAQAVRDTISFLALSLDGDGHPIPVMNTDPATGLFLDDLTDDLLHGTIRSDQVLRDVRNFVHPYPAGLFVQRLGPLVANDTYASRAVWDAFRKDSYHGPRVVWGREVNLLLMGLAKQISAAYDSSGHLKNPSLSGYVGELSQALRTTLAAVEASGLKHSELWSYRIAHGQLMPERYGTSSDVQLWNLTDLAVQFTLSRLPHP
jgi:hypothetical protein